MCCGLLGVQVVWALQNGNTSRIFQSLGANVDELAFLWIAAPITGLVIQPLVGHLSDRTWGPLGRRRPYMLGGAVLTAAAMIALPNAAGVLGASAALWLLTASVNIAAEPFRALIADSLPPERRATGFAIQTFFIGTGAVLASAMPWMMTHWLGVSGRASPGELPPSVRFSFYVGAVVLVAAVGWTVLRTQERPPPAIAADDRAGPAPDARGAAALRRSAAAWTVGGGLLLIASIAGGLTRELQLIAALALGFGLLQVAAAGYRRAGRSPPGVVGIAEDIVAMPVMLRRLALVQFFTWLALFVLWVYATPAVAARHYRTTDPASVAFGESADWVGVLFAGYNAVAAVVALLLPRLLGRIARRKLHALCLFAGAAGLTGFVLIEDATLLWVPAIGIGCAWAAILSLPYAMLADAVPAQKVGVYMGIHNIFLVLPQLAAAATLGPLTRVLQGEVVQLFVLAGAFMALAALLSLCLPASDLAGEQ